MIRFFIKNGNDWLRFNMPTCELIDHLGSIGICKDIPICCSEIGRASCRERVYRAV